MFLFSGRDCSFQIFVFSTWLEKMNISDENNPNIVKPTSFQGREVKSIMSSLVIYIAVKPQDLTWVILFSLDYIGGLEMGSRKFGQEIRHNRRVLNVLNQNFIGAKAYPCAVNKRGLSE